MKKCSQCNTVYGDEVVYCLNDGTPLVEDNFSLPSTAENLGEEATVIRSEPIIINLAENEHLSDQPITYQTPPEVIVIPPDKSAKTRNYLLFLILGLVIGGGLVLGTLLLARTFYRNDNKNASRNNNQAEKTNAKASNANQIKSPIPVETPSQLHETRTAADDDEFNGRVITLNAYIRAGASKSSAQIDVLPMNDRLNIEERENPNSPWFHVTCEHGTSGWMHGDTIEFTK